jgi:transposase-like protein
MSVLSSPWFHNEKAAFRHLEAVLWPDGPVCPHCGGLDRIYSLKGVKDKKGRERLGLYKCGHCRKQFTVRVGTVFESSHVPLHKWLQAVHLLCSSKKGISSHQLHRVLEVSYKTAWFMSHRIREAMANPKADPLGGSGKIVEADETYFGGRRRPRHTFVSGEGWKAVRPSFDHKQRIVALVERGGEVRSVHAKDLTQKSIREIVMRNALRTSHLMTDEAPSYPAIGREFASHEHVKHSADEYVRGLVHTNTIEGVFSVFKRGMRGVYQHCSERHLHRYLAEFDFRYNARSALGVEDEARARKALRGIRGKRLTYRGSPVAVG